MRRKEFVLTSDGSTPVYFVNHYSSNSEIGLAVDVLGDATYTVEYTFDDVQAPGFDPDNANWHEHPTLAGLTESATGRFHSPVGAIRMSATGVSGDGVRLVILPGGGGN